MADKLRYALVGCGRISTNHVKAAVNNKDDLEFCAVCDIIPANMENVLSKHGLENDDSIKRFTNYKELVTEFEKAGTPLKLVSIATES